MFSAGCFLPHRSWMVAFANTKNELDKSYNSAKSFLMLRILGVESEKFHSSQIRVSSWDLLIWTLLGVRTIVETLICEAEHVWKNQLRSWSCSSSNWAVCLNACCDQLLSTELDFSLPAIRKFKKIAQLFIFFCLDVHGSTLPLSGRSPFCQLLDLMVCSKRCVVSDNVP